MVIGVVCVSAGFCSAQTNPPAAATVLPFAPLHEYTSRTDRRTEPYPDKPLNIGPPGSIFRDPNFGSPILRVTGIGSDPHEGNRSLMTPSSAEQNSWNSDSTFFYVTTIGGSFLLYRFDPSTMIVRAVGANPDLGSEPAFSFTSPNILYGMSRQERRISQYDISSGRTITLNNPAKCVKLGFGDYGTFMSVSGDDKRFLAVFGPQQDKNYLVYVYDREQGCRWYNTLTGEISGQWGPRGTISFPGRFPVHNARLAKSGKFLYVQPGGGQAWVVWDVETMHVDACASGCGGHHAMGYSHIVGSSENTHPLDLWLRPLEHLNTHIALVPAIEAVKGYWYDSHFSWNNTDADDSTPVCFSTYRPDNPMLPGSTPRVSGPWENEIDCAETDGKSSKIWRFAHTYSTARNGFWSTPRGNISPDGRFFMFTSDWEDQLGRQPNGQYRSDVFIVELK